MRSEVVQKMTVLSGAMTRLGKYPGKSDRGGFIVSAHQSLAGRMIRERNSEIQGAEMTEQEGRTDKNARPWKGRIEVLLLIIGGLLLMVPTIAIFMSSGG